MVTYAARWWRTGRFSAESNQFLLAHVFDSATFAGSAMLLWGIMDDEVLKAIGSTRPFLLVAGLAGLIYSVHALAPPAKQDG